MWNIHDAAVAAAHSVNPDHWWNGFGEVMDLISARFTRYEPRRHAAGRIENAQVAVYLSYAATRGHALIDRALYLPKSWTTDCVRDETRTRYGDDQHRDRCGRASVLGRR